MPGEFLKLKYPDWPKVFDLPAAGVICLSTMLKITTCSTFLLLCAAAPEDSQRGRGGPNMQLEFDMEKEGVTGYPFKPFSKSYVKRALTEGADWTLDPRGVVTAGSHFSLAWYGINNTKQNSLERMCGGNHNPGTSKFKTN